MKTENIVFDIGNVLMKYDPFAMLERFSLTAEEKQLFIEKIFHSPLWLDADRGCGYRDVLFYEEVKKLPLNLRSVFYALCAKYDFESGNMPVNEGVEDLLCELKNNGYKLYIISNMGLNFHVFSIKMPLFSYFDGTVVSCDHSVIKPDRKIFDIFFDKFSLDPASCLFIDDTCVNVEASEKAGMPAICYNALKQNVCELRELLAERGVRIEINPD